MFDRSTSIFLGIESSCDETGVAVYQPATGQCIERLRSSSQLHLETGGVVPEIAARDHSRHILRLVDSCLTEAAIGLDDLTAIGYTRGPGLQGSLMVGAGFAKSLGYARNIPCIGIHHLEGHLCAIAMDTVAPPAFPYLALLVSGGHSHLFVVSDHFCYRLAGATRDDAAGEAFDKCATMLGIDYPGGARLAALAENGDPHRFALPRPMRDRKGYDMSFSGLKTAVRYTLEKLGDDAQQPRIQADLAASIQAAIIESLLAKTESAMHDFALNRLVIAGGVSANHALRAALTGLCDTHCWKVWLPPPSLCTDNGAMIACATARRFAAGYTDKDHAIRPAAIWRLDG